jgi:Cell division protein CrgA
MPESRRRKKKKASAPSPTTRTTRAKRPSAPWVGALILALFLIGVAWLLAYYLAGTSIPGMSALGGLNLLVGFAFVIVGLGIATQWR